MSDRSTTFGIGVGETLLSGARGYFKNLVPLSIAGAITLGTYLAFRLPSQAAADRGDLRDSLLLDLAGLVVASVIALPWYSYALDADGGDGVDWRQPFRNPGQFYAQLVASIWFWAGVLLGLRYLYGLPSIFVVVFYSFAGFLIADGTARSGLKALGTSVRLSQGRRIGLAGIGAVLLVLNLVGAIAIGYGVSPLTIGLTFLGVLITTNVSMVAGARIYRHFSAELT